MDISVIQSGQQYYVENISNLRKPMAVTIVTIIPKTNQVSWERWPWPGSCLNKPLAGCYRCSFVIRELTETDRKIELLKTIK